MFVMQLTGEPITVVDVPLPVARLPLDVEGEARRAADGRQADGARQAGPVAPEHGVGRFSRRMRYSRNRIL